MDAIRTVWTALESSFGEERTQANLAAVGLGMTLVGILWLVTHRALAAISDGPPQTTSPRPYASALRFVGRSVRRILGWVCGGALVAMALGGVTYHLAGGDILREIVAAWRELTPRDVVEGVARLGVVVGAISGGRWLIGLLRRRRSRLRHVALGPLRLRGGDRTNLAPGRVSSQEFREWTRLVRMIEWSLMTGVVLGAGWLALTAASAGPRYGEFWGAVASLMAIVLGARLAALSFALTSAPLARWLSRRCTRTPFAGFGERIVGLVPFSRRCFEVVAWVLAATLAAKLTVWTNPLSVYGLKLAQAAGVFFAARVLVEVSGAMLLNGLAGEGGVPRVSQQGRTLAPLLQSISQYAIYFCAGVTILDLFGQNPTPVLATMGVVGLAAGLGAQSLVNDLVSGFFILFEGQYLVGDYVQIGNAKGTVEAVAVRHTRIRDDQGKLYIIPNGTVKEVVNYSKGYVNAIVELKVPAGADVEAVLKAMTQTGRDLRETRGEVLGETVIHGVVDLNLTDTTVRAVTKVRPGTHGIIQNEFRKLLRERLRQLPVTNEDRGGDSRAA